MDWHKRYAQQAKWTRNLRAYIFDKINLNDTQRVLEVGCGTGAVLSELPIHVNLHGLDIDSTALEQCKTVSPSASLIQGDALQLPCSNNSFDIVYCHFLLLWVSDPLQALLEMKQVTKEGGHIIAFAEPDYSSRMDKPKELVKLGEWQTESLKRQGADPGFGVRLAEFYFQAGLEIIESGTIQSTEDEASADEWRIEWAVIESDLAGFVPDADIQKMKQVDAIARKQGQRVLHVPTYFAWGVNKLH